MSLSQKSRMLDLFQSSLFRLLLPFASVFLLSQSIFAQVPTLSSTPSVTNVKSYSAVASGNVLTGSGLTEIGFVWSSVSSMPTLADNKVVVSGLTSIGSYQVFLQDIPSNTTIYLRSYATNGSGTGYSSSAAIFTTSQTIGYNINQNALAVVGQASFVTSTPGLSSQGLTNPEGVAIDVLRAKIYVSDRANNRVLRFAYPITANNPTAEAVFGQVDFVSNIAATTQTGLNAPLGITVDNAGRLWVADNGNRRVVWFNNAHLASNGAAANGVLGQANFVSSLNSNSQSIIRSASDVKVDHKGTLWVADRSSNRVLRFNSAALKANGANADGVLGQTNFNVGSSSLSISRFNLPNSIAIYNNTLWVADLNNNRVLRFDNADTKSNGANADGVLGQTGFSSNASALTQSGMNRPQYCEVDAVGTLWVSDRNNRRVIGFENAQSKTNGSDADFLIGQSSFTSNSNTVAQNRARNPFGLAIDRSNLFLAVAISNDNRVSIFNLSSLQVSNAVISDVTSYTAKVSSSIINGYSIAEAGFVWSASNSTPDLSDNKVTASGVNSIVSYQVLLNELPANSTVYVRAFATDLSNNTSYSENTTTLITKQDIPYNTSQNALYVVGQPNFTSSTSGTTQSSLNFPKAAAIDFINNKIYIADRANNRVLRYAYPITSNNPNAEAVFGQPDFTSNATSLSSTGLNAPEDVVVDNSGRLWVADNGNRRVIWYNTAHLSGNGVAANGVLGQANFTTSLGATSQNTIRSALGISVDNDGRLWVADRISNRVLRFDHAALKSDGANADGVLGQSDFVSSVSGVTSSNFSYVVKIFSHKKDIWVVDRNANRVLKFNNAASKPNGGSADLVLGQSDFTSSSSNLTQNGLNSPEYVGVDARGTLWVSDRQNRRILGFENVDLKSDGANADFVIGQPNFTSSTASIAQNRVRTPYGLVVDNVNMLLTAIGQNEHRATVFNLASLKLSNTTSSNITSFSARLGANVVSGFQIAEVGVVWSTSGIPTTSSNKVVAIGVDEIGPYDVLVSDLPANTKIYFRGYGIDQVSTQYTALDSITTPAAPSFTFSNGIPASFVLGQADFMSSSAGTTAQKFDTPRGVAIDAVNNKVYVADPINHRVLRFSYPITNFNNAEVVLGQPNFSTVSSGTSASKMNLPFGIFVDNSGRLWVCDTDNNRVIWFNNAHLASNGAAASGVIGQPNFTSNGFGATASSMNKPRGLSVSNSGILYVVDYGNHRILRFDNSALLSNGSSANGVLGQADFVSTGSSISATRLNGPSGICTDGNDIWVADCFNHRVLKFANASSKPNGASADLVLGQTNFTSSTKGTSNIKFDLPLDCGVDGFGNLWVSDRSNNRILGFENRSSLVDGAAANYVIGQPGFGSSGAATTQSNFSSPRFIAINKTNSSIFVTDASNNRVLEFKLSSSDLPTVTTATVSNIDSYCAVLGGNVTAGSNISEVGIVWSTTISSPTISNSKKVVASGVTSTGTFTSFVCNLTAGQTVYFRAYASNFAGTAYSSVQTFNTAAAISYQLEDSAKFVVGQSGFNSTGTSVTDSTLSSVRNIAIDARNGKLYVADFTGNRILRFSYPISSNSPVAELVFGQSDMFSSSASSDNGGLNKPYGLFVDNSGRLWVSEVGNNRVIWFNQAHTISTNKPTPNGVIGQPNFASAAGGTAGNKFRSPRDLYVDEFGTLSVADGGNNRVLVFKSPVLKSMGGSADLVLGQPDFVTTSAGTTANKMSTPFGLAYSDGTLWVCDRSNSRVLRFDNLNSKNNGDNADAVLGQSDFVSSGTGLTASTLNEPLDCEVDSKGTLWVADSKNNRVVGFNGAQTKSNGANADVVIAQANFTTSASTLRPNRVRTTTSVAFDPLDFDLIVSDEVGNRVLVFDLNDPFGTRKEFANDEQGMRILAAYPNPSTGLIRFSFKAQEDETLTLAIYDVSGKLVSVLNGFEELNKGLRIEAKGLYIAKLVTNTGLTQTVKFVIE